VWTERGYNKFFEVDYAGFISRGGTYYLNKGERWVGAGPPGPKNFSTFFAKVLDK
jgi:hypothetical protein